MEKQESDRVFDKVFNASAIGDNIQVPNPHPRRTLTHLAVLAAVVLPITLLPYLAARRNINLLRRQIEEQAVTLTKLQRDLKSTLLENGLRRDEHTRVRGMLTEMKQDSRNLGPQLRREMQGVFLEREKQLDQTTDALRSDLQKVLDEARRTRTAQFVIQRELGTSLADVAAFMHEQSLAEGRETQGIERLRWLAVTLQNPPTDVEDPDPSASRSHDDDESSRAGGT